MSHVSHLEPTFPITPKQSVLSQTISVIHIGRMSGEELMAVMQAVYVRDSSHLTMPGVTFDDEVTHIEFSIDDEDERWRRICIDGDIITVARYAKIQVKVCDGISLHNGLALILSI
jgi:hypothetical protein